MNAIEYIDIKIKNLKTGIINANPKSDDYYIYMCNKMLEVLEHDKKQLLNNEIQSMIIENFSISGLLNIITKIERENKIDRITIDYRGNEK